MRMSSRGHSWTHKLLLESHPFTTYQCPQQRSKKVRYGEGRDCYVPVGKVGPICGKEVFQCKCNIIRDWRAVLQAAEFNSGGSAHAQHSGSLGWLSTKAETMKVGRQTVIPGMLLERMALACLPLQ